MRELLAAVGHTAGIALVLFAVGLALVFIAPGLFGAEASYVVYSDSMSPTISAGDVVVVTPVDAGEIGTGDIITYNTGGDERVTHRVVAVENGPRFVTKGDANTVFDRGSVTPSQVRGRLWVTLPMVGHLVAFAGTDLGIVLFVILPSILLVATETVSLIRGSGGGARQ